jgi:opacity protein-like surface antigen
MLKRGLLLALCSLIALPAMAGNFYVGFEAGASAVEDSDFSGDISTFSISGEVEFHTGVNVGATLGYRFAENFRVELSGSYRTADVDRVEDLEGAGDVQLIATMMNVYYDTCCGSIGARVYFGGGIGLGFIDVSSDTSANALVVDDSSTELAWNLLAGVSFDVAGDIVLAGGYRYLSTEDPEFHARSQGVGSGSIKAEVSAHEVFFSFRYEF